MILRSDLEEILKLDGWQVRDALAKYVAGMDKQEYYCHLNTNYYAYKYQNQKRILPRQ